MSDADVVFATGRPLGPELKRETIDEAESKIGFRLPRLYVRLLEQRNGGKMARRCFKTDRPTSWASDHFEVLNLIGIGYEMGIDGRFGSEYMIREWGYPPIGVVLFETPSGGHDTVMLDYSGVGRAGEPRVVYVDDDRDVRVVAKDFEEFVSRLVACSS